MLGATVIKKTGLYNWLCTFLVKVAPPVLPATVDEEIEAYRTDIRLEYIDADAQRIFDMLSRNKQRQEESES